MFCDIDDYCYNDGDDLDDFVIDINNAVLFDTYTYVYAYD